MGPSTIGGLLFNWGLNDLANNKPKATTVIKAVGAAAAYAITFFNNPSNSYTVKNIPSELGGITYVCASVSVLHDYVKHFKGEEKASLLKIATKTAVAVAGILLIKDNLINSIPTELTVLAASTFLTLNILGIN